LIGGIELIPTSAYGVRLYRNGSSMVMHNDKVSCDDYDDDDYLLWLLSWQWRCWSHCSLFSLCTYRSLQTTTHVISSIVHITHEYDNDDEPWPIEIDDHDGVLRAVDLKEGQVDAYTIVLYACNQMSTSCRILLPTLLLSLTKNAIQSNSKDINLSYKCNAIYYCRWCSMKVPSVCMEEDHNWKVGIYLIWRQEYIYIYIQAWSQHHFPYTVHQTGKYYGSLFVHYQPADKSLWDYKNIDVTYNVPPHWSDGTKERYGSRWAGE
jgi:hypothetical protein